MISIVASLLENLPLQLFIIRSTIQLDSFLHLNNSPLSLKALAWQRRTKWLNYFGIH